MSTAASTPWEPDAVSDLPGPPSLPGPPTQPPGWGAPPPPPPGPGWEGSPPPPQGPPSWGGTPPPPAHGTPAQRGRLRPVGDFLSASFTLITRSALPLLPLVIVAAVPVVVSFVAADAALGLTDWFDEFLDQATNLQPGDDLVLPRLDASRAEVITWVVVLLVINVLATLVASLAGLVTMWAVHQGERPGTSEILGLCRRAMLPLLGLISSVFVLAVLAMIAIGAVAVAFPPFLIIVFLASIPLTLWLAARFSIAIPIAAFERRGFSALGRSHQLTAGDGWGVLGRLLLFSIILSFALQLVSAPVSFLGVLGPAALAIGTVLSFVANLATSAIAPAGSIVLYADLTETETPAPPTGWGQPI